ncbi:hypothetical protein Droror1_Dr00001769 [Drosera rotundifolia]
MAGDSAIEVDGGFRRRGRFRKEAVFSGEDWPHDSGLSGQDEKVAAALPGTACHPFVLNMKALESFVVTKESVQRVAVNTKQVAQEAWDWAKEVAQKADDCHEKC